MRIAPALLLLLLAAGPASESWDFEKAPPGAVPPGFAVGSGRWAVAASEGGRAVAQLAESPDDDFNVLLADAPLAADLDLSVRLKAVDGVNDRGGGLVWRARDARNYYVARYNHLEDNLRLYKVVDGRRSPPLASADVPHHDGWTVLRVTMTGDRIAVMLDGRTLLEARDATFTEAGRIGLWSKSDARTLFDDLAVVGR